MDALDDCIDDCGTKVMHSLDRDTSGYFPRQDRMLLPVRERFHDPKVYCRHELTQDTEHESRLACPGIIDHDCFGPPQYAIEELIAQMGSAFLCGIRNEVFDAASPGLVDSGHSRCHPQRAGHLARALPRDHGHRHRGVDADRIHTNLHLPLVTVRAAPRIIGSAGDPAGRPCRIGRFRGHIPPRHLGGSIESELTRFVIGGIAVSPLVYMSEIGVLILRSGTPLGFFSLFAIFLLRTLMALPIFTASGHLLTQRYWLKAGGGDKTSPSVFVSSQICVKRPQVYRPSLRAMKRWLVAFAPWHAWLADFSYRT